MMWIYCILLVVGFSVASADYAQYEEFVRQQATNETFVRLFKEHLSQFQDHGQQLGKSATFHCEPNPQQETNTTSVHKLRPVDIKVVAALGDSITAGTGINADTVIGLLRQDRGLSWSIGGDESIDEENTIPNMLKIYNPSVHGFSTGFGPSWWIGNKGESNLNTANPGDKSEDMPGQAVTLVDRMKADSSINFDEDWKVITLFIGGNDLCDFCDDKEKFRAENYVAHVAEALDYLHANVPRAFVNLVEVLDISIVKTLNQNLVCDALHLYLCACAAFPADSQAEAELQAETVKYRTLMNQMVVNGRYDTRDDFTVIVQPFFRETSPPIKEGSDELDLSYFAPDCFHLSLKGHRAAADALWNNMIEPIDKKRTKWTPGEIVTCPSEVAPYFYTYKNSGSLNKFENGLGLFESETKLDSNNEANKSNMNQSGTNYVAMTTVATVAGVLILMSASLYGLVVWKRRHSNKSEREILLRTKEAQYYTAI